MAGDTVRSVNLMSMDLLLHFFCVECIPWSEATPYAIPWWWLKAFYKPMDGCFGRESKSISWVGVYSSRRLLVRMLTGAATVENSTQFSQKTKNRTTIWHCNSTPGYIPRKAKYTSSKRYTHSNVHSSTIYSSQYMEATQVSIKRQVDEEDVIYIYIYICESHSVVPDSLRPHGQYRPWNSPGQNTGVGSHSFLQGNFPTQGSNLGLPHCRQILHRLTH